MVDKTNAERTPAHRPEELALFKLAANGDLEAREQIIINYTPLVKSLASKYLNRGVDAEDLFQEGFYGLIVALNRFDPSLGVHFSVYARKFILKYVKKAAAEQSSFNPFQYNEETLSKAAAFVKAVGELREKFQREPTDSELASYLRFGPKKLSILKCVAAQLTTVIHPIDEATFTPCFFQGLESAGDMEDLFQVSPRDICRTLTRRENEVLMRRFGYISGHSETWAEISAATGLSVPTLIEVYRTGLIKLREAYQKEL